MLDYQPQLLTFQRQIQESNSRYWAKIRTQNPSMNNLINAWRDNLDSCSDNCKYLLLDFTSGDIKFNDC